MAKKAYVNDGTDWVELASATTDLTAYQQKVTGVSDTEIGYLDGVTSAIQTQINTVSGKTLPTGGTVGQVLSKIDETNYNAQWVTQSGGGTSKVIKSSVSLGTIAVSSSWTEIEITDLAQRGLVSLIEITSNISGLYNLEIRSASGGSGSIMLLAEGISQLYSATIPWYYEADTGNSMWIRIKNVGSSSMTFTLNSLRIEKFA